MRKEYTKIQLINYTINQIQENIYHFKSNEEGAIIIFYAVLIPIIIAFAAFVGEAEFAYGRKGGMQAAADAAAMAGALQIVSENISGLPTSSTTYQAVKTHAEAQIYGSLRYSGYENGKSDKFRTVNINPPVIDDVINPYTITVSLNETRVFGLLSAAQRILGNSYTNSVIGARSEARVIWHGDNCILALAQSGEGTFTVHGTTQIGGNETPQCGIAIDSSDPCALSTKGNSVDINVPVYVVGGICMNGNATVPPVSHGYYLPDPYDQSGAKDAMIDKYRKSEPLINPFDSTAICTGRTGQKYADCTLSAPPENKSLNIDPSTWITPQGTLTLSSGTYILKGGFSPGSQQVIKTAPNANVSIIVGSGSIKFGAQTEINLKAPTSGAFEGIALACIENCINATLIGGPQFSGSIYAPNAHVEYTGNPSSPCVQIVANTISLGGNTTLNDQCIPSQNRSANYMARLTQ